MKKVEITIRHGHIISADADGFRGQGCQQTIDKLFEALQVQGEQTDHVKSAIYDKELEQEELS